MWYTRYGTIFPNLLFSRYHLTSNDDYSRYPQYCHRGRFCGRCNHTDCAYDLSDGLLSVLRGHVREGAKPIHEDSPCPGPSLLLSAAELSKKDFCRTAPRALSSSCPKDCAPAKSIKADGTHRR